MLILYIPKNMILRLKGLKRIYALKKKEKRN